MLALSSKQTLRQQKTTTDAATSQSGLDNSARQRPPECFPVDARCRTRDCEYSALQLTLTNRYNSRGSGKKHGHEDRALLAGRSKSPWLAELFLFWQKK